MASNYFDWNYYSTKYIDIFQKIKTPESGLRHWIRFGMKEGRICNKIFESINSPQLLKEYAINNHLKINNLNEIYLHYYKKNQPKIEINNINVNINNITTYDNILNNQFNGKNILVLSDDTFFNIISENINNINIIRDSNITTELIACIINNDYIGDIDNLIINNIPIISNLHDNNFTWSTIEDIIELINVFSYNKIYKTDDIELIKLFAKYGYIVESNINYFNTINIIDDNYKLHYSKSKNIIMNTNKYDNLKNSKPLIYIPINKNYELIKTNYLLLKNQTVECIIIFGIRDEEDMNFAIELGIDYVYCNNDISIYCKIYNSKYLIYVMPNDLLSLKYVETGINYMKLGYNYLECNYSFMITDNQVYELKYENNNNIKSGCIYDTDLFDMINWTINIENKKTYIVKDDNNMEIISINKKNKQIISQLLSSNDITYKISGNPKFKLMINCNNIEILKLFKNELNIKYAYITYLTDDILNKHYVCRLQIKLIELLKFNFEIINLDKLDKYNLEKYEKILIDGSALNIRTNNFEIDFILNKLNCIKNKNNYILLHDLHDWSLGFSEQPNKEHNFKPILYETDAKIKLKNFFNDYNIKNIISITDGPECQFLKEYLNYNSFNIIHDFLSSPIFNTSKTMNKDIDILFYGWDTSSIYPFRNRILNLCKNKFKVHQIKRQCKFIPDICEDGLRNYISRSWIAISCSSTYDYAIRKYYEISESGSVVVGNTNNQISLLLNNNMIILNENMSDAEIINKISYFLNNKILLIYYSFKVREHIQKYNDNNYIKNIKKILENDFNNIYDNNIPLYNSLLTNLVNINLIKSNNIFKIHSLYLEEGDYILELDDITIQFYNDKLEYMVNIINKTMYIYIKIVKSDNYNFDLISKNNINFINKLCLHKIILSDTNINKINIVQNKTTLQIDLNNPTNIKNIKETISNIYTIPINNVNLNDYIYTTSLGAIYFSNKIASLYDKMIVFELTKNLNIYNKNDFKNNNLFLIGLYASHKFNLYYHNLFNTFNKIFILFAGTDILEIKALSIKNRQILLKKLSDSNKYILFTENENIMETLKKDLNINTYVLPLPINNYENFDINFDTLRIACYLPQTRKEFFNYDLILNVAKSRPQYKFIFYDHGGINVTNEENKLNNCTFIKEPVKNTYDIYKMVNCGMRITFNDGEPLTGIEMMSLGLHFIFNHELKYCIEVKTDLNDILDKLDNLAKNISINKEGMEYYKNRNSIDNFIKNINSYNNE